ncbi:hypothetical protein KM043_005465 [Ampulex compressa]|nr:hypothetical protein KM043_005465 [Ampulex compressa]
MREIDVANIVDERTSERQSRLVLREILKMTETAEQAEIGALSRSKRARTGKESEGETALGWLCGRSSANTESGAGSLELSNLRQVPPRDLPIFPRITNILATTSGDSAGAAPCLPQIYVKRPRRPKSFVEFRREERRYELRENSAGTCPIYPP